MAAVDVTNERRMHVVAEQLLEAFGERACDLGWHDEHVILHGSQPRRRVVHHDAEARLVGQPLDSSLIRSAAAATWLIEPISDIHAGAEYRRHLAQVLSARALTDAARRAGVDVPNVV